MSWAEIKKAVNSDLSKSLDMQLNDEKSIALNEQLNKNVDVPLNYLSCCQESVGSSTLLNKLGSRISVSAIRFNIPEHTSNISTSTQYRIIETTAPTILYALIVQIYQEGASNKTQARIALNNAVFQSFSVKSSGTGRIGTGGFIVGDVIQPISDNIQLPIYLETTAGTSGSSYIYNTFTNSFRRMAEREWGYYADNTYKEITDMSCHKNLPKPVYTPGGFFVTAENGYYSSAAATSAKVYVYAVYQSLR